MSHPELSSGGGSSMSSGKLSKLLVSVGEDTCGATGGEGESERDRESESEDLLVSQHKKKSVKYLSNL